MYYKGEKLEPTSIVAHTDFHSEGDNIRKELGARIPARKGLRVLDIGTGYGQNVSFLGKILPTDSRIWTLDPSEETLENAQKLLQENGLSSNVTFVKGTTEKLPFENDFFDVVVSVVVLHHLQRLEQGLKEMLRVLKRGGGRLILIDWNPEAHVLPFSARHKKDDFFEPEKVVSILKTAGVSPAMKEFQYWYVVETATL